MRVYKVPNEFKRYRKRIFVNLKSSYMVVVILYVNDIMIVII